MEIRIFIFLALVMVTVVANTVAIFCAYRIFARMTARLTATVSEVQQNTEVRETINALQVAAEQAATVTETTKRKFAEFDPILDRAQENYRRSLLVIDSKLETSAEKITTAALKVRDTIAKPAFSVATFAAGMTRVLDHTDPGDE